MNKPTIITEELVAKARKGDTNARAGLYKAYRIAMYNICIRMTGNKADAEDVLQDAFIHAFEHLSQIKVPAAFGGWLRKIVVAGCIRISKKQIRWNDLDNAAADVTDDDQPAWWTEVTLMQLNEEIKNLPDGCRQVFVLFVLENFGHRQIAENLGISESTSKSQYQRARKLLQERITKKISVNG